MECFEWLKGKNFAFIYANVGAMVVWFFFSCVCLCVCVQEHIDAMRDVDDDNENTEEKNNNT